MGYHWNTQGDKDVPSSFRAARQDGSLPSPGTQLGPLHLWGERRKWLGVRHFCEPRSFSKEGLSCRTPVIDFRK